MMSGIVLAGLIVLAILLCLGKRVEVYDTFLQGVASGFETVWRILPVMLAVMSGAYMLRESGLLGYAAVFLAKLLPFELPEELITLALLRPVSGGGSVGLLAEILNTSGADSETGRIASVIAASSETTLYVLMVYFGSVRTKYSKGVLFAALFGDFVCVLTSFWAVKTFF